MRIIKFMMTKKSAFFLYPLKISENQSRSFLMFLGDIERDQWHTMG